MEAVSKSASIPTDYMNACAIKDSRLRLTREVADDVSNVWC